MQQDLSLAYLYFLAAAELGHPDAATGLQTLDTHLTAEQKQLAQQQLLLQKISGFPLMPPCWPNANLHPPCITKALCPK